MAAGLGLPLVTAGDLIRDQIKLKTEFGLKFKEVAERGELINPLEVNKLMKQRLREADCDKGSRTSKLAGISSTDFREVLNKLKTFTRPFLHFLCW